jgi:pimeloyl-ACP methyl ester carboxylesterase
LAEFTATDGVRIHYRAEGAGRPLLLLHGLMAHGGFWAAQQPLSEDFRLIAPDLRGHGESRAEPRSVTVDRLVRDTEELAEALDLQGAIVVGWSLGAAIAWPLLAGRVSARFAGSVVVDMTPKVLNEGGWTLGLAPELVEARAAAFRDDFAAFAHAAGTAVLAPPIADGEAELAAWAGAEFARNDNRAMSTLWASLAEQDYRPLLARISQPTLILRGAHSYLYGPDTARYLESALPSARIVEFGRSGHAPNLEEPELFNKRIIDFAAGLAVGHEVGTLA